MIVFLLQFFPKLSEAFILDDLCGMERLGVPFTVWALRPWPEERTHPDAKRLLPRVTYLESEGLSRRAKGAALAGLALRSPRRTLAAHRDFTGRWAERLRWVYSQSLPRAARLRRAGATHLHAHFAGPALDHAFVLSRLTGIPFSFTAHGSDLLLRPHPLLGPIAREAAAIFTPTRFNRDALVGRYGVPEERIVLAANGVDTERFRPSARRETGMILTVARLHPVKGLDFLIDAYEILAGRGIAFRARIVGDGPERGRLERKIRDARLEDRVRLEGSLARGEVLEMLGRAEIFALASHSEGLPMSVLEAMSCALPVVATRITGLPELVEEGETGHLVPPGNAAALADRLERLLADGDLRARMGRAGRERVASEYRLEDIVRRRVERLRGNA
ncbi:MAG: glycosyltransferase [Candidatus Eisenbacteria bacterium]|nr:glycosyltransferase [Candidatus Eisenbacteria bacterium]